MREQVHVGSLAQLRPVVNFANRMSTAPGQAWGPRTIPDCQLIYVISGQAELALGPERMQLGAGDCVFYGAASPHRLVSSDTDPFTFASIHFSWDNDSPDPVHPGQGIAQVPVDALSEQAAAYVVHVPGHGDVAFPHRFALPNLEGLFLHIVREYRDEAPGFGSVLRGLLTQLIVLVVRHRIDGWRGGASRSKIEPALEAICIQPHKNWKMEELARLCGYHPTYFASLFRETTGHSPKHFLVLERIRKAKQLLPDARSIEEVAYRLGYASVHYFCRNFKEVTGTTPSEYRQYHNGL